MPGKPPPEQSVLVQWMGRTDANAEGAVHGGTIMKLCDEAAALAAVRHCHSRVVTAGVPSRTPLVTLGGRGSLWIAFLLQMNVVWTAIMAFFLLSRAIAGWQYAKAMVAEETARRTSPPPFPPQV